jgi:hypothetical protein
MFCSNCGAMMDFGHKFCAKCGQKAANPLPREPVAPPIPNFSGVHPEDDGDEAVLYRKSPASYFTGQNTWVTGAFVIAAGYIVFYPIRFIKTFRVFFHDISAVSDAYQNQINARFAVRTTDGRVLIFSLNTVDIAETQAVVNKLRQLTGAYQVFQPL